MRRSAFGILLILMAATLGIGAARAEAPVELIFAHTQRQSGGFDPVSIMAAQFKAAVETGSQGKVLVHIFPESSLGGNRDLARLVEKGVIHTALASPGGVAPSYPLIALTQIPFLFDSRKAAMAVYDGPFGQDLARDMESRTAFTVLGFGDPGGFHIITNSRRPVLLPADMKGLKIRAIPGFSSLDAMIKAAGAVPVKVGSREEFNALASGVADGQMLPPSQILGRHFDEVQRHATLTNHIYSPSVWLFNQAAFNALDADTQTLIRQAAAQAIAEGHRAAEAWESSEDGFGLLRSRMRIIQPTPAQKAEFLAAMQPVVKAELAASLGADGVEWMNRLMRSIP
jgi:tripartite ATP-independent transporter DctP family solute receptor